jgi:hypothetical protein
MLDRVATITIENAPKSHGEGFVKAHCDGYMLTSLLFDESAEKSIINLLVKRLKVKILMERHGLCFDTVDFLIDSGWSYLEHKHDTSENKALWAHIHYIAMANVEVQ